MIFPAILLLLVGCQGADDSGASQQGQPATAPTVHAVAVQMAKAIPKPISPALCAGLTVLAGGHVLEFDRADGLTERSPRLRFLVIPGQVILFHVTEPGTWIWEGATTVRADSLEASWFNPGTSAGLEVQTVVAVRSSNG